MHNLPNSIIIHHIKMGKDRFVYQCDLGIRETHRGRTALGAAQLKYLRPHLICWIHIQIPVLVQIQLLPVLFAPMFEGMGGYVGKRTCLLRRLSGFESRHLLQIQNGLLKGAQAWPNRVRIFLHKSNLYGSVTWEQGPKKIFGLFWALHYPLMPEIFLLRRCRLQR